MSLRFSYRRAWRGAVRALGEPLGGSWSTGTVACLGAFLSGLFSRFVVGLSFSLYQFPGTIFDIWEGDFSPFSAACSGDRSRSISCVSEFCGVDLSDASSSSHPVISSVSSCVAFELVKTAHVMTHSLLAPSHHLIRSSHPFNRPVLLPVLRHGWRGGFFCLPFCGRCRCGRPFRLSGCVVSSLSRLVAIVLGVGSPCSPVVLWSLVCRACFALSSCRRRCGEGIISLFLAPLVRYGERGAGSGRCLRRGMVSSCPHGMLSSRLVLAVGMVAALFASPSDSLSSPSRSSCRPSACFASLRYSPRPATRRAGRSLAAVVLDWLVACAVACRAWGGAACPHGVLSSWVVLAVVREGVLCGLCGWSGCLSFLWYICIIN